MSKMVKRFSVKYVGLSLFLLSVISFSYGIDDDSDVGSHGGVRHSTKKDIAPYGNGNSKYYRSSHGNNSTDAKASVQDQE